MTKKYYRLHGNVVPGYFIECDKNEFEVVTTHENKNFIAYDLLNDKFATFINMEKNIYEMKDCK